MSKQIKWVKQIRDKSENPFSRNHNGRPLRITIHDSQYKDVSDKEAEALEALRELGHLSEIEVFDTHPGPFYNIKINQPDATNPYIPVTIEGLGKEIRTGAPNPEQLRAMAQYATQKYHLEPAQADIVLNDLIIGSAHSSISNDILITTSIPIHLLRTEGRFSNENILLPSEAIKIVGLLLRSRNNYTWSASAQCASKLNKGLFYWILARRKLPSMWKYFSVCCEAGLKDPNDIYKNDIIFIGQSIIFRCSRALQACDIIGMQFYLSHNNDTRDDMMYHFNYLLLLLTGAIDAQARIAHRVYKLPSKERNASFHKDKFNRQWKEHGAITLDEVVSSEQCKNVLTILYELRNTIHSAELPTFAKGTTPGVGEESFVTILPNYAGSILKAANATGGLERWGLIQEHELNFEPYTFSKVLVDECLKLINAIAGATDMIRLIPNIHNPNLIVVSPTDGHFREEIGKRVELLG